MLAGEVLRLINEMCPAELAESYDNVGLLTGHPNQEVKSALFALDLTEAVIDEAVSRGAQLIVTHHPILFHARKNLREDNAEGRLLCRLVRANLALIAAHTNYDNAAQGVNDCLAAQLGLVNVQALENGLRVGDLPKPLRLSELATQAGEALQTVVRPYAAQDVTVTRLAVCGGAGGEFYPLAMRSGAQVYLTGEIRYHDALNALADGMALLEAGHYETEQIAIKSLANRLQEAANALQYKITVMESALRPYARLK